MTSKGNDVERRGSDVMQALRAADPAGLADLARTDERAFTALREGITMTAREPGTTTKRRGRRTLVAGGLAVALLGGGAAYAARDSWSTWTKEQVIATYKGGGNDGGVSCLSTWVDPQSPDAAKVTSGGPSMSADPIADCQRYQEMAGKPPIEDPVAFSHGGGTYVTPRKAAPPSAEPAPTVEPNADALMILRASLGDYVDGGNSRCFTKAEAEDFVKRELDRLGLAGLKVTMQPFEAGETCAWMHYDPPTGVVMTGGSPDGTFVPGGRHGGITRQTADALRKGIAEQCVSLAEAEAVAVQAMGAQHHWPTSAVMDAKSKCTTVDLQVGGSMQVFLRGPSTIAK